MSESNHPRGLVIAIVADVLATGGDDSKSRRKTATDHFGKIPESILIGADRLALVVIEETFIERFREIFEDAGQFRAMIAVAKRDAP